MFSLVINEGKETKTEKILKGLLKNNGESVKIGHFSDSGIHPDSNISFVDLMKYHSAGDPSKNIPSRPVLEILVTSMLKVTAHKQVANALRRFKVNGFDKKALEIMLKDIGEAIGEEEVNIFGSHRLAANAQRTKDIKGSETPLVDTQDLVREVSYKDSITKKPHKIL